MIMWIIASIVWALGLFCFGLCIFITFFNGFDRMINWSLKREAKRQPPAKYPEYDNYAEWMRKQVAYYRKTFPDKAWHLLSPYQGAYLPLYCFCGFSWNDKVQAEYRKVKDENLDLVALAIKNRPEHYANVISRFGDEQDYDFNIRLYS